MRRLNEKCTRAHMALKKSQRPPRPSLRKRQRPHRRKAVVLAAIPGTKGIWAMLAKKLDCSTNSIQRSLSQEGWEHVLEAFEQERVSALGGCVNNVFKIAAASLDVGAMLRANTFILEKLHPDFAPTSKLVVEGGKNPIQHNHRAVVIEIPAEAMGLPVEDRMKILEAVESKEKELNDDSSSET